MKKFINHPEHMVEEMLQGFAVLSPVVAHLSGYKVMLCADGDAVRDHQVAIISGGGSGHEPALAAIGRSAIKSLATIGVSFSAGTSPTVGKPSFELGDDER